MDFRTNYIIKYLNRKLIMDNNIVDKRTKGFIPLVGMQPRNKEGNGYKGIIEYVGKDYFILRSFRTDEPVLIRPFQYHNFEDYILPSNLHPIFLNITNAIFPNLNEK